jgi:UDPglucose 6-dehydrogenase
LTLIFPAKRSRIPGEGLNGSPAKINEQMKVAIIGTGYVGLTTGVCLASIGHSVTCIDSDESKIEALKRGEVPIYEPYLAEVMEEAKDNLDFTTSYADSLPDSDAIFIAVGTPPSASGSPNLEYLAQAAKAVGEHVGAGIYGGR